MRLPSKPILIRIVIYGSLISFFGWRAYVRFSAQSDADRAVDTAKEAEGASPTRTMKLSDGSEMPVLELTPEEAERQFGVKPEQLGGDAGEREAVPADMGVPEPEPEAVPEERPEPRIKPKFQPPSGDMK